MVAVNSVLFNILYFITSYENSEELYLLPPTATKPTVCSGGGYDDKRRRVKNTSSALLDLDNPAMIFSAVIFYAQKLFYRIFPIAPSSEKDSTMMMPKGPHP
jgi:hypothetical protein